MSDQHFYSAEARAEPFGYSCNRCLKCCVNKRIQVNPYEVARLAKNRGVTTGEFRERFTVGGEGTVLDQRDDGSCVFLGDQGCTLHPDRPLVCRLYPIGRQITMADGENFVHLEPHPETKGIYSKNATIADYLQDQQTMLYIKAADEYFVWFCKAVDSLQDTQSDDREDADAWEILDMDCAISSYCTDRKLDEPVNIEERKSLHLQILDELIGDRGLKI